jgi:predicted Zn-dependent protease
MTKFWTILLLLTSLASVSNAQNEEASILEKAMMDELHRNMDSLRLDGYEQPFFISYTVVEATNTMVAASLGALSISNQSKLRNKFVRVMVGDYDFNDESFDLRDNNNTTFTSNDIRLPIDDDYAGIRRAFWISTDAVYKSASKLLEDNKYSLKEQTERKEEVKFRKFIKTTPVDLREQHSPENVNRDSIEQYVRSISSLFKDTPEVSSSRAIVAHIQGDVYLYNSEGSKIKLPLNLVAMYVSANAISDDNKPMYDQLTFFSRNLSTMPALGHVKEQVMEIINGFEINNTHVPFDDSYEGPVLFMGEAVSSLLSNVIGTNRALIASKSLNENGYDSYRGSSSGVQLGKKVIAKNLNLVSIPKLKQYGDTDLLGSYQVDAEGVVPGDSLVLIQRGMLQAQMNDRTVVDSTQTANGHRRFSQQVGPGVLSLYAEATQKEEELKEMLIEKAKEEDLDYAIIVRKMGMNTYQPFNVFKVSLEDGSEELLTNATLRSVTLKSLNKVIGVGNRNTAHNFVTNGYAEMYSLIAPNALLIEDVEVESGMTNYKGQELLVDNPVE